MSLPDNVAIAFQSCSKLKRLELGPLNRITLSSLLPTLSLPHLTNLRIVPFTRQVDIVVKFIERHVETLKEFELLDRQAHNFQEALGQRLEKWYVCEGYKYTRKQC